jgi:hypothetical protein
MSESGVFERVSNAVDLPSNWFRPIIWFAWLHVGILAVSGFVYFYIGVRTPLEPQGTAVTRAWVEIFVFDLEVAIYRVGGYVISVVAVVDAYSRLRRGQNTDGDQGKA